MAHKHVLKADFIKVTGLSIQKPCPVNYVDVPWKTNAYDHAKLI